VKAGAGYGGNHDRMLDLRVDDHLQPMQKALVRSTPETGTTRDT
jgi:uncharacterized Ntn-hydrolase superfamily protein